MKELSIEQKEKRYDEVFKEVKDFFEGRRKMHSDVTQTLEYLFPELKGSDDEDIRKEIMALIEWSKSYSASGITNDDAKKMLAWIKKIGEQKPVWSEYDEHIVKDIIYFLNEAKVQYANTIELEGCIHWLWSLLQRMGR